MKTDAHAHFDALSRVDPGFLARYRNGPYLAVTSVHDAEGLALVESMLDRTVGSELVSPDFYISFGVHPQYIAPGVAETLCDVVEGRRVASRALVAIGECGFDFYGDAHDRVRTSECERVQRDTFEAQLELAMRHELPLVLHVRKAIDLVFAYASRLARLPAVVFHSWNGPPNEAAALIRRGVPAYFSFGASVINGNKKAASSCAMLPADRVLAETDAPWQPPAGNDICTIEHISDIMASCARLRGIGVEEFERVAEENFRRAYGIR